MASTRFQMEAETNLSRITGIRLEALVGCGFGSSPGLNFVLTDLEAEFAPHMLYVTNQDKPGFIGRFGATLAGAGINIATFHLGRAGPGGDAICLVSVDEKVPEDVLSMVRTLPLVVQATTLAF